MTECEHNRACRMAYGDEGCKPPCDLGFPCHLYERKVDRDALLELADEMDDLAEAWGGKYPTNRVAAYARSIREACGAPPDGR